MLVFILAFAILMATVTAVVVSADPEIKVVGEMVDIKSKFSDYLSQDTVIREDSYVGTLQYTVYYDNSNGPATPGYFGTPVIIYTINHPGVERVGTDSNETIIGSMLDRGYIVIVLDYLNSEKAVSPDIDKASQGFRGDMINGKILKNTTDIPKGEYREAHIAPSGCNVLLNEVFWEIDKHSTEGTLEKIVENWNSDFRATKGSKLLEWVHEDGTRKATQDDFDGNAPVWYNADGTRNDATGTYTYVKFTKAETITDCVDPDGTFLDMNLYINIVYPTSPEKEVPIMALANSSGYPTTAVTGADIRPHSAGYLYNGYANVVFDYLWEPMARNASWGYYDGSAGVTQDHMNYALMTYNDKLVNTAAMRYLRYLSLSGGETYNFDLDAIGVYGNSKGGWFSYLGEEILQSPLVNADDYDTTEALEDAITDALAAITPDRYYDGRHGETRYQVGAGEIVKDGFTVKAGEKQPWLTYNGVEILSGCQLTNACNGSQQEDISAGHSPVFISGNMTDTYNAAYAYSVDIYNICRELGIPLLHFEVPIGHTLTSGMDMNHNVDTYDALFRYVGYYLKDEAISVAYSYPMNNAGGFSLTSEIKIGFAGAATLAEVEKITVSAGGTAVSGVWESSFGGTVWTFYPSALLGSTEYTLTVPEGFCGDNGVPMAEAYTVIFTTEADKATETVQSGNYYTLTAPSLTFGNSFVFRFFVSNDAANIAKLYAVNSIGETSGELLGSVNLRGAGSYEIDITDYIAANEGKSVTLLLAGAEASDRIVNSDSFDGALDSDISKQSLATLVTGKTADGETCLMGYISKPSQNGVSVYYSNPTQLFSYKYITGGGNLTVDNLGRRYTIEFDVYDTVSRTLQIKMNSMTKRVDYGTIDYNNVIFNVTTKANEWTHVEYTYEVYEPDYGFPSDNMTQSMHVYLSPSGDTNAPAYFNDLVVTEHITAIDVTRAVVAEKDNGAGEYNAPVSDKPFAIYNGAAKIGEYSTFAETLAAYTSGYTVKLQKNYALKDADLSDKLSGFATVNLDLGTYTLRCENTKNSLFWLKATAAGSTVINIQGGAIRLGRTALVSYEGSNAGKTFSLNFKGTYIGLCEKAFATEYLSALAAPDSAAVKVNMSFDGCTFDLPDDSKTKDASILFTTPISKSLTVNYTVIGGEFKLSSQRWISILDNAKIVEFEKDASGNYTKLLMPESVTVAVSGSYLIADGYAAYKKESVTDHMVTYGLVSGENSTRYGIITDDYADVDAYPVLLFKNGVLVSAHTTLASAITAANGVLGGDEYATDTAEIYMRKSMSCDTEPTYGGTAGTLVIDLGGNTLKRNKVIINAVVNSSTPMFDTNVLFKNGRIETGANVIAVTHCLYTTDKIKTYNITFEDVTIGFSSDLTAKSVNGIFWTNWQNGHSTKIVTNITLDGCTIDLENNIPTSGGTLFVFNNENQICNLTVKGGEIKGSGEKFTLAKTDSYDSVVFAKDNGGEYTKFTSVNGGKPTAEIYLCDDGLYREYQATESGYEFKVNDLVTAYGVIPTAYADENEYPFVIFNENKGFVGAYKYYLGTNGSGGALNNAKEYVKANVYNMETGKFTSNSKKAFILLRRNYTLASTATGDAIDEYWDNMAQIRGEITLDLGGFVLSQNPQDVKNYGLFPATSKRWETTTLSDGSSADYTFPSTVNVKNGTMLASKAAIIKYNSGATSTDHKVFTLNFDNVTFGLTAGATTSNLLLQYGGTNYPAGLNINLNDCVFDLNINAPANTITLINTNNTLSKTKAVVKTNGITVRANDLSKLVFTGTTKTSNFSLVMNEDEKGHSAVLETLSSNTPNTNYFYTDIGKMYFVEHIDDGSKSTYYLENSTTPYGTVPHSTITGNPGYLSAIDYPFVLFQNGEFKRFDETWGLAVSHIKDYCKGTAGASKTAEIVLRRDYTTSKTVTKLDGKTADDSTSGILYEIGGTMVIDLAGYTITRGTRPVFDIYGNVANADMCTTTIVVKNGNLVVSGGQLIGVDHGPNVTSATGAKVWNLTFEGVTFSYASGATSTNMIVATWTSGSGYSSKFNLNLDNCVFDLTNAPNNVVLVNASDSRSNGSGSVDYNVTFNGGSIIGSKVPTLVKTNAGDSYSIGKYDGKYPSVTLPTDVARPTSEYTATNGNKVSFGKESASATGITYRLGEAIYTEYGYIPYMYSSTEEYPFVIFDGNKVCIGADDTFLDTVTSFDNEGALNIAKAHLAANVWDGSSYGASARSAVILMRRDYQMTADERYNNIAQVQGNIIIDLGGYKLTAPKDRSLFAVSIKPWGGSGDKAIFPSEFKFVNGDITLINSTLLNLDAWTGDASRPNDYVKDKYMSFTFENIDFSVTGTSKTLVAYALSGTPDAFAYTDTVFNNCTFDITGAKDGFTLFNVGNGKVHNSIKVTGGEIIAKNNKFVTFATSEGAESSLVFAKAVNENYMLLTLPEGVAAPTGVFGAEGGSKLVFVKVSEVGGKVSYRLRIEEAANVNFTPKMNITLDRDLIVNVYIPAEKLLKFTFDGKEYTDFASLEANATEIDGAKYYALSVPLVSSEAAREIKLIATVDLGETDANATYTFSTVRYAKKLIDGGAAETEVKLVKDILAYIKAAYEYFGKADSAEIAPIPEILGEGYNAENPPALNGSAAAPSVGLTKATFVLKATPAVRFYIPADADASSYEFFIDGVKLATVTGADADGKYIEMDVYAYLMSGTITYTVNGEAGGSYHIRSYYEYSKTLSDAKLVTLVERFASYCESAKAYRDMVNASV